MASCVTQAQGAHCSRLGRLNADGALSRSCATEGFSHNKGYLGRRPLARRREQARCETKLVWVYPAYKENEMKRIDALRGMIAWLVLLPLGAAAWAQDVGEEVQVDRVLTADQIDSTTVDVGAFVVVIYGQGERHPVSGAWTQLDTVRGSIKAVDLRRLIVGLAPDGWSKWIALERIQTLSLLGAPLSAADRDRTRTRTTKRVSPAQAEPEVARSDSLSEQMEAMVKRYHTKVAKREDAGLRVLKKVAAGTFSGIVSTGIAFGGLGEVLVDDSYSDDGLEAVGLLFVSLYVGNLVGFPLGVSKVDPHDSLGKTLLSSCVTGLGGLGLAVVGSIMRSESLAHLGVMVSFVAPPIVSIAVSEKSRKPPQARRVSFGLSPTPNGGLSTSATLRF